MSHVITAVVFFVLGVGANSARGKQSLAALFAKLKSR
jgi:hypothetical protein